MINESKIKRLEAGIRKTQRFKKPQEKKHCKRCGKMVSIRSKTHQCFACGVEKSLMIALQLKKKKGYYYNKWRKAYKKAARRL